ncbi:hypothetical protein RND81_01G156200 [Saponaria officinalis]|uniref:Protein kinase domain-containing protein n=1 Tax=Saponaria officinalis TaxID=3572 RepID=A0AAW1NFQ0_SAPOF
MHQLLQTVLAGIASFIAVSIVFFFIFLFCKCRKKSQPRAQILPQTRPHHPTRRHGATELSSISIPAGESASFDPRLQEVSMAELVYATDNFNPKLIIGDGSFGLVYKAKLTNGVTVALKKLSPDAFQGHREFRAEMETLGKLRHPNIVKMLGYCVSGRDRVLIYEFIEKGSLDEWLQDLPSLPPELSEGYWISPLSWNLRVKIVKGVADGLAFMHELGTPIVHRDIKASNVLLDNNFEAHITDFGLARSIEGSHSHVSTQAAGTVGYMPPEYRNGYTAASVKGDVYSFGVLMFEVATGKRPNWPVREDGKELWMVEWVKKRMSENNHLEVIDSSVSRDSSRDDEVYSYLKIADLCTSHKPKERPLMREVVEMLETMSC